MKKVIICCFTVLAAGFLYAQECPNYPADCPETGTIEASQSIAVRTSNHAFPQVIKMQDNMRSLITIMMENISKKLHWPMVELTEFTSEGALYTNDKGIVDFIPYPLAPPAEFSITFQFIVNKDSLQAWKNYQSDYDNRHSNDVSQDYNNITATTESPLYKRYKDSADHYMNLYLNYVEKHKDEGAALYTKDKHPAYYQKKQTEFLDKMTALTDQTHENAGIESEEALHEIITKRFINNTVVQVRFHVNDYVAEVGDLSFGSLETTSKPLPIKNVTLAKLYTIGKPGGTDSKWKHTLFMLLGNFHTTPSKDYKYQYHAGFASDKHTPKKIKTDKVQDISISITGNKKFIEKMVKFIDVDKLYGTIVKF